MAGAHVTCTLAIVIDEPTLADLRSLASQVREPMSSEPNQMAAVQVARRWAEDNWSMLQKVLEHPLSRPARPNPITHQPPTLRRAPRPHKFTAAHISPLAPTDGPLCCAPGRSYLEMAFEPHHHGGALAHLLLRL